MTQRSVQGPSDPCGQLQGLLGTHQRIPKDARTQCDLMIRLYFRPDKHRTENVSMTRYTWRAMANRASAQSGRHQTKTLKRAGVLGICKRLPAQRRKLVLWHEGPPHVRVIPIQLATNFLQRMPCGNQCDITALAVMFVSTISPSEGTNKHCSLTRRSLFFDTMRMQSYSNSTDDRAHTPNEKCDRTSRHNFTPFMSKGCNQAGAR